MEILIALDPDARDPLRRQLERELRAAIGVGHLPVGTRLPSTRALAAQLGVSRGVVVEAYDQLAAQGFLAVRPGAAPTVAAGAVLGGGADDDEAPAPFRHDFGANAPDTALFPRAAWLRATQRALASLSDAELDYPDGRGATALRAALAGYLGRVRGIDAQPRRPIVTQGFLQSIDLVCRLLRERGAARVGFEDPSLERQWAAIRRHGMQAVAIPVDGAGIDVASLAMADVQAIVVSPAHQFPTGSVLTPERRRALAAWAQDGGRLIVENDYDAEFRYDRRPIGALQGMAPDHTFSLGTTSKTLAPGLRLGWIVAPVTLAPRLADIKLEADGGSSVLHQHVLARLIQSGDYDRHIRRCRHEYRLRRDVLAAAVAARLPDAGLDGASAGLHVVLRLPSDLDDETAAQRAREQGIRIRSVSSYRLAHEPPMRGLVLGYGKLGPARIAAAIADLAAAIDACRGKLSAS